MNAEEKDKLIVEVLGESRAVWFQIGHNLATPEGFFWIWERIKRINLFDDFMDWIWKQCQEKVKPKWTGGLPEPLINPTRFRDALAEFLEKRK